MDEYTNLPVFDEDDGSNLFVDATEETTEDAQKEEEHVSTEEPDAAKADTPSPDNNPDNGPNADEARPGIKIVFRGEERDLTYDEAVALAQKGMHYEGVRQERDDLKAARNQTDSSLREVEKWAQQAGMELPEYIQYLQTTRRSQAVEREITAIRQKYPDIPEEAAKEMAETRIKDMDEKEQQVVQQRKSEAERAQQKPWDDFIRAYPHMDAFEKIPAEVVADINDGATPIEAMLRYEKKDLQKQITDLQTKIGQLEQNKKNKETALPAAGGSRDTEAEDPFLAGMGF